MIFSIPGKEHQNYFIKYFWKDNTISRCFEITWLKKNTRRQNTIYSETQLNSYNIDKINNIERLLKFGFGLSLSFPSDPLDHPHEFEDKPSYHRKLGLLMRA